MSDELYVNKRKTEITGVVFEEKNEWDHTGSAGIRLPSMNLEKTGQDKREPIQVVWKRVQENMPAHLTKRREIEDYKRSFLREDYKSLTEEEKQKLRDKDTYTIKKLSTEQVQENRSKNSKLKIGSISDAILEVCPEAYHDMYDNLMDDNKEEKEVELVHSVGDRLLKMGHDVLEIDVGGSSFHQFRREYNGYHGKSEEFEGEEDEQYGRRLYENNNYEWIKQRNLNGRNKTRYTIAGPLKADGLLNGGDYSIENDRKRILDYSVAFLLPIFTKWLNQIENQESPDFHDIDLLIRGHSRGGVAVSHGSMMVKAWIAENYPMFDVFVHFRTTQIDPVPGGDVETVANVKGDLYERFDISEYDGVNDGIFEIDGQKMKALSEDANTTVIYSIANQDDFAHNKFFNPQEVLHGKRVILIPTNHDSGLDLDHIDTTQMGQKDREKAHGMAYYDAHSGKVYRNSGITEMDEGVFIMDENQILVKVESEAQLKAILDKVMKKGHQEKRQKRIMGACASVLADKSAVDDYIAIDHIRTKQLMDTIASSGKSFFASDYRGKIADAIDRLKISLSRDFVIKGNLDEALRSYDDVIEKCSAYIRKRDSSKWTDRGVRRLTQIKSLHRALSKEKRYLLHLRRQTKDDLYEVNRSAGSIESVFSHPAMIEQGDVTDFSGGTYRVQRGDNVSFFEKKDATTARGMALCSIATEAMGQRSLYQGVMTASMTENDEISSGIVKENIAGTRLNSLKDNEKRDMTFSANARKQFEKIRITDIIFGVDARRQDPYNDLYGDIKRDKKDGHIVVNSVLALCPQSDLVDENSPVFLSEEEKEFIKNATAGSKSFIRSIDPIEVLRAVGIVGLKENERSKLELRITQIKNLLE